MARRALGFASLFSFALAATLAPLSADILAPIPIDGPKGIVSGEVANNLGQTLPDVVLYLEGTDVQIPLNGERSFAISLPAGRHVLLAGAFGYRKVRRPFEIKDGEVTNLRFVMTSVVHTQYWGFVQGDGRGVQATFEILDTPVKPRQTKATGDFRGYLPYGKYRFRFEAPGFYPEPVAVTIPGRPILVELKPLPAQELLGGRFQEQARRASFEAEGLSLLGDQGPAGIQRSLLRKRNFSNLD